MSSIPTLPRQDGAALTGVRGSADALARWFGSLFEVRVPAVRADVNTYLLFAAILAVGTFLRFWGLGSVGLHGDEETMAMPTMHLVEHGAPLLPSGMLYPRAIAQLYMMAGSVLMFGESEWSFRLPSVVFGILTIVLSFYAGRRFLTPAWNLAFTATVALLPELIVDAQTARMYTFLIACIAGYLILLFRWERTDNPLYLAAGVLTLIVGIQFHTLAVFAAFLAFYPGLVRGELHKVLLGAVAFAVIVAGFAGIDHWITSEYPATRDLSGGETPPSGAQAAAAIPHIAAWMFGVAAVVAAGVATFIVRRTGRRLEAIAAVGLIALGLLAQVAFSYHLAGLLIIAGLVVASRTGQLTAGRFALLALVCGVLAAGQFYLLHSNDVDSPRQIVGAMLGWPSIWPQIAIGGYSVAAALFAGAGIVAGLWLLTRREPVPDHVLFAVLGVWIPILIIGFFEWNVPLRYTAAQIFPMLLAAFAAMQWLVAGRDGSRARRWQGALATVACIAAVNPLAFARTVNSGYATHPDHQGAAAFIQSINPGPRDIVIAEDVLQQTYYLGHVDYWLQARNVAGPFVLNMNGVLKDFYTNTPLVSTPEELQALIDKPDRGAIYIIGSGENQEDGRRFVRGAGLAAMLESNLFRVVYRGRDNLTTVLKLSPPGGAE